MKKTLALLLAALAILLCFAACGKKNDTPSVYYLNFKPEQDTQWKALAKTYTEKTGVPVTVVTAASGTYEQTLTSEMDKTEAPTLFQVNGPVGLANWIDYCYDFTGSKVLGELTSNDFALTKDGKVYGIPAVLDPAEGVAGLYYRSDWLEALNMAVPTNMDEVNDMLVAFAKYGPTVNGNRSTAGIGTTSGVLNLNFALGGYFQCYGSYPNRWVMRDGQLVNGLLLDETVDALNGLRYLYENGAIATDFATWNSDTFVERVTSDQVGATFGTYYIAAWPLNNNKEANHDAEWAEIDMADLGGKAKPAMNQASLQFFNVVTKDAPAHAEEACIKMLNLTLAQSGSSTENKDFFQGRDLAANGATPFWLPAYMYYPTPWARIREHVWAAYDAKDTNLLTTDYERELYGYMDDWFTNGVESDNLGNAWGQYKSRLPKDMGSAVGLRARETGYYETNYFYGPTTDAESRSASTLSDLTTQFVIQYILGEKTEADWQSFKDQYNKLGGEDIAKAINEQYAAITQ